MPSAEFVSLASRLDGLKRTIPKLRAGQTSMSPNQLDKLAALALFTSAACEQFIEDRSRNLTENAIQKFELRKKFGRVARFISFATFIETPKDKNDLRKISSVLGRIEMEINFKNRFHSRNYQQIHDLLKIGYGRYKNHLSQNHGISLKHQFRILCAIGFDISSLNPTFKSRIVQISELRGEAAHKTAISPTLVPDPADVGLWLDDLKNGFEQVDIKLDELDVLNK